MPEILPISAIIPTRDRVQALARNLESLSVQAAQPAEIIIVDASSDAADIKATRDLAAAGTSPSVLRWMKAAVAGAAQQRNQGVSSATQPFILFCDDDVLFEEGCLSRLWSAMKVDGTLGGVNAMITNQQYHAPGKMSHLVFTIMNGGNEPTFAGRMIGPAINLLPEDRNDLPEVVRVDWLNLGCTLYRRDALPDPPFDSAFTGYSLMEDVTLSLRVAQRGWKLANVRTARIFHDSQAGEHKSDPAKVAAMELVNRYYVMTKVLVRDSVTDHAKLALYELFQFVAVILQSPRTARRTLRGKLVGLREILRARNFDSA